MTKLYGMLGLLIILSASCSAVHAQEKIVVCGTGDSQQLLTVLAENFEKANPGTIISIPESIGSGGGIKATAMGKCDLGRVARNIKESEKKYGLTYKIFAKSPVVFAVHSTVVDISNLTSEELVAIYMGKLISWKELGGPGSRIYPISREEGDSANSVLINKIKGFNSEQFVSKVAFSEPEAVELLTLHEYTIAYLPLAAVIDKGMNILHLDGIEPSIENVKNGKYKLVLDFGVVYSNEPKGLARKFLDYLYTLEAGRIMDAQGAIPVK